MNSNIRTEQVKSNSNLSSNKKKKLFGGSILSSKKPKKLKYGTSMLEKDQDNSEELDFYSMLGTDLDSNQLKLNMMSNEVLMLKDEYMKNILIQKKELDTKFIDFEALDSIYISTRKLNFLRENLIVSFASSIIYK